MIRSRMAVAILAVLAGSTAGIAQDAPNGLLTKVDRINGVVAIRPLQPGTVGSSVGDPVEYRVQDRTMLDSVHAGDRVNFTASDSGGTRTVTRLQRK